MIPSGPSTGAGMTGEPAMGRIPAHRLLAVDYLGAERDNYSPGVGRMFLISMVARVMRPGLQGGSHTRGRAGHAEVEECRELATQRHAGGVPVGAAGKVPWMNIPQLEDRKAVIAAENASAAPDPNHEPPSGQQRSLTMSSSSAFAGRLTLRPSARIAAAQIVGTLSRNVRPRQCPQRGLERGRSPSVGFVGVEDGPLEPKELDAYTSALSGAVCGATAYGDRCACQRVGCTFEIRIEVPTLLCRE